MVSSRFEGVFAGVEEQVSENSAEQEDNGELAEDEALGEGWLEREDVVGRHVAVAWARLGSMPGPLIRFQSKSARGHLSVRSP